MFEEHGVVRSDHLIRIATDGQMQQDPNPVVEDGVAAGNSSGAASAHPDGTTARERDEPPASNPRARSFRPN